MQQIYKQSKYGETDIKDKFSKRRDNLNLRGIYLKNIQKKASINEAIFYFDKQKASLSAYRTFFFKKYG